MSDKRTLADNREALRAVVESLGGSIVPAATFQFEIPLAEIKQTVPKLNQFGLRCRKISERVGGDPRGTGVRSVATLELYRDEEKPGRLREAFYI